MDAQQTPANQPCKKTLMLDTDTVRWGEALAKADHRGCLSNVVKFLIEREWRERGGEGTTPKPEEAA